MKNSWPLNSYLAWTADDNHSHLPPSHPDCHPSRVLAAAAAAACLGFVLISFPAPWRNISGFLIRVLQWGLRTLHNSAQVGNTGHKAAVWSTDCVPSVVCYKVGC